MQQWYQCPNCGAQVAYGMRFCGKCGIDLSGIKEPHRIDELQRQGSTDYPTYSARDESKIGPIKKARTGFGCFVQIIGGILWFGCGLLLSIWTLYVLFSTFGIWTIFVGIILAPITYVASIFVIWFSTGVFPVVLLIPYVLSFIGMAIISLGSKISGTD
jgi:hypothetical protein